MNNHAAMLLYDRLTHAYKSSVTMLYIRVVECVTPTSIDTTPAPPLIKNVVSKLPTYLSFTKSIVGFSEKIDFFRVRVEGEIDFSDEGEDFMDSSLENDLQTMIRDFSFFVLFLVLFVLVTFLVFVIVIVLLVFVLFVLLFLFLFF